MLWHAQVVDEADVQDYASQLVAKLKLSYVVNVQFRRDGDGKPKLMEINPRIPGTIGLTIASGGNMPYFAVKMILDEAFDIHDPLLGMTVMRHWDAVYIPSKQMLK